MRPDYRVPVLPALLCGAIAAIAIGLLAWMAAFLLFPPSQDSFIHGTWAFPHSMDVPTVAAWLGIPRPVAVFLGVESATTWPALRDQLEWYGFLGPVLLRLRCILAVAVVAFGVMFCTIAPLTDRVRIGARHIKGRGRVLRDGANAWQYASKLFAAGRRSPHNGRGIFISPGVQLDFNREREGWIIIGAPRSGKTQQFRYIIDQILARSNSQYQKLQLGASLADLTSYPDKIICLDEKGDYTQCWPEDNFFLLAPHDTGDRVVDGKLHKYGRAWDITRDVRGWPACQDFARAVVQPTDEAIWGDGARQIVAGILFGLQYKHARQGTSYGWKEIRDVAMLPDDKLRAFLMDTNQVLAAKKVMLDPNGEANRTSACFLMNIETGFVQMVQCLAAAWGDYPLDRYFSFAEWLHDEAPPTRTIILQGDKQVETISQAWISAVVRVTRTFVSAKAFKESRQRRTWLLMDEFAQFASKDDGFLKFMEVGAGKGFCVVMGLQVIKQLDAKWSEADRESLEAMGRTKQIFRTEAGAVADYISEKWIGMADWERRTSTTNAGGGSRRSNTSGKTRESEPVVRVNYFADHLGQTRTGCRFLLLAGEDVCRLEVPFSQWTEKRSPGVMAEWVYDPGYSFAAR